MMGVRPCTGPSTPCLRYDVRSLAARSSATISSRLGRSPRSGTGSPSPATPPSTAAAPLAPPAASRGSTALRLAGCCLVSSHNVAPPLVPAKVGSPSTVAAAAASISTGALESAAMAAVTFCWQPSRQSPKPRCFCCVKPGQPARAGARSKASGSHTNFRRLVGRRQGGAAKASPVTAAAVAAAATLPASRVKSWPTANVLAAANGGVGGALRSVNARPVGFCPDASPVGRAPQGGRARSRECTRLAR